MTSKFWIRTVSFLIIGYCLMGRSFAYLGIPPLRIFIGEIVLAAFLLAGPETARGSWVRLARRIQQLRPLVKFYSIFLLYGIIQVLRGIALGHPPLSAVRDLAFNYYPVFLLLGLWVGVRKPNFPPNLFRLLAWCNGIYGVAYILFLNRVNWTFPGVSEQVAPVPIFGLPEFSFVILLGLLAYEPNLRKVWHLLALNAFVLLGMQIRAEWFGLAIGLFLWGWLTKNLKRMMAGGAVVILLLAVMFLVDFRMQGPESRGGGEISARDLIGRAVAPLDPDMASQYTSSYQMDVGTAVWRTMWWVAIWQTVNQSLPTSLFGFGYGFPIGDLSPFIAPGDFIQTPHNVFFYALAYTGWVGVLLLALFQIELARLLWGAYRKTGQPCGIILWISMLAFACFTPFFEVPQGAIPFYLLIGAVSGAVIPLKRAPHLKLSAAT
ncbi:MAG: O-antigen ligase family protein [Candidatus Acidiferrales bacterium]